MEKNEKEDLLVFSLVWALIVSLVYTIVGLEIRNSGVMSISLTLAVIFFISLVFSAIVIGVREDYIIK